MSSTQLGEFARINLARTMEQIAVDRSSGYSAYSLSWRTAGARYHVWLKREDLSLTEGTLFKNPLVKRGEPGYFNTRQLDVDAPKNRAMIQIAFEWAKQQKLIEAADQRLADEAERERLAREAAIRRNRARDAAPAMLEVLKAMANYWGFYAEGAPAGAIPTHPLHPGALLLGGDTNTESIYDAVQRVVKLAEEGQ